MTCNPIPHVEEKGVYTLLVKVDSIKRVQVGRLGQLRFSGLYAYTGSAVGRGSTSLGGRVSRHLRNEKKTRWHIDYLLRCPSAEVRGVVTSRTGIKIKECEVSQTILNSGWRVVAVDRFGSSDCSCRSHLVHMEGGLHGALQAILRAHKGSGLTPRVFRSTSC